MYCVKELRKDLYWVGATDRKISLWVRRSQMVVTDAKGEILWLVGHRIDHRFRITSSTTSVLKMELL